MSIETKRGYITKEQVESYCDIAITDEAEAIERMNYAEELIDQYVGYQSKFLGYEMEGVATGGSTTTLEDNSSDSGLVVSHDDNFTYCRLEIIGGTNAGESRTIISSTKDGVITLESAFSSAIDSTSVYRIYQLSKFPRAVDYKIIGGKYYKYIPEQIKNACLFQVQYMIEMGDDFFNSEVDKDSGGVDGYSYQVRKNARRMISPKARFILGRIMNRKGKLIY